MKIEVFVDSLARHRALRRYIPMKLKKLLRRHARSVDRTTVRLRDINADKGGVDKECTVVVRTAAGTVVTKAVHEEAGGAFRMALRKLLPNLRQRIDRRESVRRADRRAARSYKFAMG